MACDNLLRDDLSDVDVQDVQMILRHSVVYFLIYSKVVWHASA